MRTTIETHPTGTFFDFAAPTADMVHVEDIARALSQSTRFNGHTSRPLSIAEHALLVSRLVRQAGGSVLDQFGALHHDSHEAYIGDIPTPVKNLMRSWAPEKFDVLINAIDAAIETRFGLLTEPSLFHHPIIKAADQEAILMEASKLKVSRGVGNLYGREVRAPLAVHTGAVACHDPQFVEGLFLAAHYRLAGDLACQRLGLELGA